MREHADRSAAMYRNIVVPIEGTGDSGAAVDLAIELAGPGGGTIELVAVHALPSQKAEIETARARIESSGLSATATVLSGKAADALTDHVMASLADVVIMTPASGLLERLLLGSVTNEVVRRGGKPILMVPPALRGGEPMTRMRRMLVTLDGSEYADQVIPHAERLAQTVRGQMTLLTVVEPMMATVAKAGFGEPMLGLAAPVDALATDAEAVARARKALDRRAAELRARGIDVVTEVVLGANAARAIVEYVSAHAVDLVAISTYGRGGLKQLVMGSVAHEVFHKSNALMLVLRPHGRMDSRGNAASATARGRADRADRVDQAGRESFPASDPPSWSTMISRAPDDDD
jgi:nucleotide-binding universal stress UspA family protein